MRSSNNECNLFISKNQRLHLFKRKNQRLDKETQKITEYNFCCNCNHCVLGDQCRRWNKRLSNNDLYRKRKLNCWTDIPEANNDQRNTQ